MRNFRLWDAKLLSKLYYLPAQKNKAMNLAYGFRREREFFGFIKKKGKSGSFNLVYPIEVANENSIKFGKLY
jgi:hypothetical protein